MFLTFVQQPRPLNYELKPVKPITPPVLPWRTFAQLLVFARCFVLKSQRMDCAVETTDRLSSMSLLMGVESTV